MRYSNSKNVKSARRKNRLKVQVRGTQDRPRLTVFKSLKHLYLQVIDDAVGKTLVSTNDFEVKGNKPMETAQLLGEKIAEKCAEKGIKKVVFDRNGKKYHGLVRAVAEAARSKGLDF